MTGRGLISALIVMVVALEPAPSLAAVTSTSAAAASATAWSPGGQSKLSLDEFNDLVNDPYSGAGNRQALLHPLPATAIDWVRAARTTRVAVNTDDGTSTFGPSNAGLGSWTQPFSVAGVMHGWQMPGGMVYSCSGSENTRNLHLQGKNTCRLFNPMTGSLTSSITPTDMFCAVGAHDATGAVVSVGGTDAYLKDNNNKWAGSAAAYRITTSTRTRLSDMSLRRWYPSATLDQNGRILVSGGSDNNVFNSVVESLAPGGSTFTREALPWKGMFYPDLRLIGPDRYAFAGSSASNSAPAPAIISFANRTITQTPGLRSVTKRNQSAGLLAYPAQNGRVFVFGGGTSNGDPAINLVDMIDYRQASPKFVPKANMPVGVMFVLATVLPNGQMFVTGGTSRWRNGSVLWAAFYDPDTDLWTPLATPTVGRNYHSVIVTNLDGTVNIYGGNPSGSVENRVERYSPWYMSVPRPTLSSATATMGYGASYPVAVTVPAGTSLGYITLSSLQTQTHSSDPNFRVVDLPYHLDESGSVIVDVPADSSVLPPGVYRMAANTTDKIPSPQIEVTIG
jgi:hypothetical protein